MKFLHLSLSILILGVLSACSTCENDGDLFENRGLIIRSTFAPDCAKRINPVPDELVVRSDSALSFYYSGGTSCNWKIDFEQETLLRYTSNGQCNVQVIREVRSNGESTYLYQKNINECGDCNLGTFDEGWVVVDINDEDAEFKFRTIRN